MKLRGKDRALLVKSIEEAGEYIKAAADLLQGKGNLSAVAEEAADVKAVLYTLTESFQIQRYQRVDDKAKKYERKYGR